MLFDVDVVASDAVPQGPSTLRVQAEGREGEPGEGWQVARGACEG